MRLYNSMVSGNCWKVRQIAAHLGIRRLSLSLSHARTLSIAVVVAEN